MNWENADRIWWSTRFIYKKTMISFKCVPFNKLVNKNSYKFSTKILEEKTKKFQPGNNWQWGEGVTPDQDHLDNNQETGSTKVLMWCSRVKASRKPSSWKTISSITRIWNVHAYIKRKNGPSVENYVWLQPQDPRNKWDALDGTMLLHLVTIR